MVSVLKRSRRSLRRDPKPPRAVVLSKLISRYGAIRGAELGVFRGDTFFYLLERHPGLVITGVDTWLPGDKDNDQGARSYSTFPLESFYEGIVKDMQAYKNRATLIRKTTNDASENIPDGSLDFVFIDADHTYEGVKADINHWYSKIKPGGFISGHDIDMPSVKRAVVEMLPDWFYAGEVVWCCGVPDA